MNFIEKINEMNNLDDSMDYIFNTLNELSIEHKYSEIDNLLSLDYSEVNENLIIGILTITSEASPFLKKRTKFYINAYKILLKRNYSVKEISHIITGLK